MITSFSSTTKTYHWPSTLSGRLRWSRVASRPWVSYRLMALPTTCLVKSAAADLGGMEATAPRAMRSASARVSPASGCGISIIAALMACSTSAAPGPGAWEGMEAMAAFTIRSTSPWVSPASCWGRSSHRRPDHLFHLLGGDGPSPRLAARAGPPARSALSPAPPPGSARRALPGRHHRRRPSREVSARRGPPVLVCLSSFHQVPWSLQVLFSSILVVPCRVVTGVAVIRRGGCRDASGLAISRRTAPSLGSRPAQFQGCPDRRRCPITWGLPQGRPGMAPMLAPPSHPAVPVRPDEDHVYLVLGGPARV